MFLSHVESQYKVYKIANIPNQKSLTHNDVVRREVQKMYLFLLKGVYFEFYIGRRNRKKHVLKKEKSGIHLENDKFKNKVFIRDCFILVLKAKEITDYNQNRLTSYESIWKLKD